MSNSVSCRKSVKVEFPKLCMWLPARHNDSNWGNTGTLCNKLKAAFKYLVLVRLLFKSDGM